MGAREILLAVTAALAGLLALWAWKTGEPGEDMNKADPLPAPKHSSANRGEITARLRPPPPPPAEERWPRKEDMPWHE